jgi:hypothetical protein
MLFWSESYTECPVVSILHLLPVQRSGCGRVPAICPFAGGLMYEMCDALWLWGWMLRGTSHIARKERTRTVIC